MPLLQPKYIVSIALLCGLLASFGAYAFLSYQDDKVVQTEVPSISVVVASGNIREGGTLYLSNMRVAEWPENLAPNGSFEMPESLIGRILKTDAIDGEPILAGKLAPEGSTGGVTSLIPPGMRAMTVGVNVVSGVGGFVHPNAKVDIIATVNSGAGVSASSKTVLQNVTVLAIDQTLDKATEDPMTVQSVTVLVTPEDAEKLAVVASEATLQLTLRNQIDENLANTKGVELGKLVGVKKTAPVRKPQHERKVAPKPKKKTTSVEIIRSGSRSEVEFSKN